MISTVPLLAATACTDNQENLPPPAPSVATPAQDAQATAQERALATYRGMWQAYAKAGLTANPDEPELTKYADGRALQTLKTGLASYRSKRQVIKGEFGSNPRVTQSSPAADPKSVTISDCLDGTRFLVYDASGQLADDEPGGRRAATATVDDVDGAWKVTTFAVQEVGTC